MKVFNILLIVAGIISVGLGTAGIFLPILPTTPFYLLALFCFTKSSPRFHRWFTESSLYKKHLESFSKNRSMTLKTKLSILIPVSIMLVFAIVFIKILAVRIFIALLLLLKIWYFFFKIKTTNPAGAERKVTI